MSKQEEIKCRTFYEIHCKIMNEQTTQKGFIEFLYDMDSDNALDFYYNILSYKKRR